MTQDDDDDDDVFYFLEPDLGPFLVLGLYMSRW